MIKRGEKKSNNLIYSKHILNDGASMGMGQTQKRDRQITAKAQRDPLEKTIIASSAAVADKGSALLLNWRKAKAFAVLVKQDQVSARSGMTT